MYSWGVTLLPSPRPSPQCCRFVTLIFNHPMSHFTVWDYSSSGRGIINTCPDTPLQGKTFVNSSKTDIQQDDSSQKNKTYYVHFSKKIIVWDEICTYIIGKQRKVHSDSLWNATNYTPRYSSGPSARNYEGTNLPLRWTVSGNTSTHSDVCRPGTNPEKQVVMSKFICCIFFS